MTISNLTPGDAYERALEQVLAGMHGALPDAQVWEELVEDHLGTNKIVELLDHGCGVVVLDKPMGIRGGLMKRGGLYMAVREDEGIWMAYFGANSAICYARKGFA